MRQCESLLVFARVLIATDVVWMKTTLMARHPRFSKKLLEILLAGRDLGCKSLVQRQFSKKEDDRKDKNQGGAIARRSKNPRPSPSP